MSEKQYAEVSRIIDGVLPFMGGFLVDRSEVFASGKISRQQLAEDLRFARRKVDEAITELSAIRFPSLRQRREHAKFIEGLRQFRRAVDIVIDGTERIDPSKFGKATALQARSTEAVRRYVHFIFKTRLAVQ
ncbi:hypothetical protein ACFSL6_23930 [Paenibacillus thailandensis]|uniref:hypothetical protein n=1 Tax=Paenibacillus thailandensis TaxID=393250 RepID=UPI00362CEA62